MTQDEKAVLERSWLKLDEIEPVKIEDFEKGWHACTAYWAERASGEFDLTAAFNHWCSLGWFGAKDADVFEAGARWQHQRDVTKITDLEDRIFVAQGTQENAEKNLAHTEFDLERANAKLAAAEAEIRRIKIEAFDRAAAANARIAEIEAELKIAKQSLVLYVEKSDSLQAERDRYKVALEKIAIDNPNVNHFDKTEQECQFYINTARAALSEEK